MILRTLLFTPATHERRVAKALAGAADGVILDLEDSIAVSEKAQARTAARQTLNELAARRADKGAGGDEASDARPFVVARVNGLTTPFTYADLCSVVTAGLDGIVLPKAESAGQLETVDWLLTQLEREAALPEGSVEVMPIIETALGVRHVNEIAGASPRVRRLNFGAGDFSLDTNMTWTAGHEGILWARIQVVIASRAARLEPPVDTVYARLDDDDGLRREAEQARSLGFQGKACIHPRQVEIVNAVFTPADDEVEQARAVVAAFDAAEAEGVASIRLGGQFIDYPVAARAQRILEVARQAQRR